MHPTDTQSHAMPIANDAIGRTTAIAGLAGIALIHALQLPEAFSEAFYLGLLFVGASVAAVALAATLTSVSNRDVWTLTATLPALILLGYLLSRTTGLPDATNDVGEWDEPLGLASVVVESLVVCVSVAALARSAVTVQPAAIAVRGGASWAQRCAAAAIGLLGRQRDDATPPSTTSDGMTRAGSEG